MGALASQCPPLKDTRRSRRRAPFHTMCRGPLADKWIRPTEVTWRPRPFISPSVLHTRGRLQYGLGYLQHSHLEMPLWRESRMLTAPSDATFMSRLHATTPTSMLPPLCILVMRPSPSRSGYEFVRLHLVVVDVNYHWATRNHGVRYIWPFLKDASPYCTPMACDRDLGAQPFCNERFAFGYAKDNSTYPLFLLHPVREQGDTFSLISVRGGDAFLLNSTPENVSSLWNTSLMPFEPPL